METDEEIIARVEKALIAPSLQTRIEKVLAEQTKDYLGCPNTEAVKRELQSRAESGIRQILETVRPEFVALDRLSFRLSDDGNGGLTLHLEMALPEKS